MVIVSQNRRVNRIPWFGESAGEISIPFFSAGSRRARLRPVHRDA
jgi:hypothetical protein